jgi:hypothetical protein
MASGYSMRALLIIGAVVSTALSFRIADAQQMAQAAAGAARAGIAAAVRGEVKLVAVPGVREIGKDVASGDPIFLGDQVTTGAEGRLQIMLADETVFTIGPNAAMTIDTFVYDPTTSAGKVTATVLKGTFRFVTGKVAKREPSDMEVKLPVGSIGVRGTSVAGETDGTRATVILLGPGPDTSTSERVGRILVRGTGASGAATTVEIVRPGFGTEIAGLNVAPSAAVRIDPVRLNAITSPLSGTAPRPATPASAPAPGGGGQSPTQQGEPRPSDGPIVGRGPAGPVTPVGPLIRIVAPLPPPPAPSQPLVPNGATTHEQLKLITGGTAVYQQSGILLTADHGPGTNSGTFSHKLELNFGTREVKTTLNATYQLNSVGGAITNFVKQDNYGSQTGPAGAGFDLITTNITAGHTAKLFESPRNVNGKIAAVIDVKLEVFTSNGLNTCANAANCARGGQDGIPRTP